MKDGLIKAQQYEIKMKKIFLYFLIFSFINYTACYSSRTASKEAFFSKDRTEPVSGITILTKGDKRISVYEVTFQVIDDTVHLEGISNINTEPVRMKIALADIQSVEVEKYDSDTSTGLIIGLTSVLVVVFIIFIVASTYEPRSCAPPSDLSDWD